MGALTFSTTPGSGAATASLEKLRTKLTPLAAVVVVHALVFYCISSGLMTRMVDVAVAKAVMVDFVELPQEIKEPTPPKIVPVARIEPPSLPFVPVTEVQLAAPPVRAIVAVQTELPVAKVPAPAPPEVASAPVAPPPVASAPRTITSGVQYILAPQVVYPQMSRRMGEQGKVVLRILVNENGKPDQVLVQTSSGSARLDEAGRQAALRALFKPYIEDGRAVPVYAIVPLVFTLAS